MTDHILVNFQTVHSAAEEVKAAAARINQLLEDLKGDVTKISGSWEGAAQQGYRAHQAQWDAKAADLQQVCAQIAGSLEAAALSYKSTEDKNANLWQH
ncbi:WXG100 family type VII secretion target [Kitasatospora aureofaciens]|uniref:WXG100 family type VII secretion target n=1 Tax=Kitasatospora aureofaciens TaxID=1894 RepID=UPI001C45424A|nr:WXG100 family type VII secretion target [Kitasatospora aureofaciens]MBV6702893.1 WXG100 family type VII secretion target [Kitasatospora aureofaciens]